jgi:hypothetical protein
MDPADDDLVRPALPHQVGPPKPHARCEYGGRAHAERRPLAARVLLRILLKAYEKQSATSTRRPRRLPMKQPGAAGNLGHG